MKYYLTRDPEREWIDIWSQKPIWVEEENWWSVQKSVPFAILSPQDAKKWFNHIPDEGKGIGLEITIKLEDRFVPFDIPTNVTFTKGEGIITEVTDDFVMYTITEDGEKFHGVKRLQDFPKAKVDQTFIVGPGGEMLFES